MNKGVVTILGIIIIVTLVVWGVYIDTQSVGDTAKKDNVESNDNGSNNGTDSSNGDDEIDQNPETSAYNFTLKDLSGGQYSLSNLRKDKPVVIAFWATWCPTCQVSAPKLISMLKSYNEQLSIIAIASKEEEKLVLDFMKKHSITYPVLLDPEGQVALEYGVGYNDFYVFLNEDGTVYKKFTGGFTENDIVMLIDNN